MKQPAGQSRDLFPHYIDSLVTSAASNTRTQTNTSAAVNHTAVGEVGSQW
jgi:hypothetical protein